MLKDDGLSSLSNSVKGYAYLAFCIIAHTKKKQTKKERCDILGSLLVVVWTLQSDSTVQPWDTHYLLLKSEIFYEMGIGQV